mgnify:CR=1 FL=1
MSSTAISHRTRSRNAGTPPPNAIGSSNAASHLTASQERELESELRRELAAIERRLASERQAEPTEGRAVPAHDAVAAARLSSDTVARRDGVASASRASCRARTDRARGAANRSRTGVSS